MVIRKMEGTLDKVVAYGQLERKPKRFNVTETQAYREVYANNLRMYSFLMKKVFCTPLGLIAITVLFSFRLKTKQLHTVRATTGAQQRMMAGILP